MVSDTLLKELDALSTEDRLDVMEHLTRTTLEPRPALTPQAMAEIRRRDAELREHPEIGIPWEEVRAELKARLA